MTFYARDGYEAEVAQTDFTVTFPYISSDHIQVYIDGALTTDWTLPSASVVRLDTACDGGESVIIRRATSPSTRIVDWSAGTVITEADLDYDSLQNFYMSQEVWDFATEREGLSDDGTGNLTASNRQIKQVADPTDDQDAATKKYVDDADDTLYDYVDAKYVAAGNVPTPTGGDTGKPLLATGAGTWGWSGTLDGSFLGIFTGDSGAGGVKGAVPAPSAGYGASDYFLHADGTWTLANLVPEPADPADDDKLLTASGGAYSWQEREQYTPPYMTSLLLDGDAEVYIGQAHIDQPALTWPTKDGRLCVGVSGITNIGQTITYGVGGYTTTRFSNLVEIGVGTAVNFAPVNFYCVLEPLGHQDLDIGPIVQSFVHNNGFHCLTENGYVISGGNNAYGQHGDGTTTAVNGPRLFSAGGQKVYTKLASSDMYGSHSSAYYTMYYISGDGLLTSTGYNGYGQRAANDTSVHSDPTTCLRDDGMSGTESFTDCEEIWAAGSVFGIALALDQAGDFWSCGYNGYGQLGLGDTTNRSIFVQCTALPNADTKGGVKKVEFAGGGERYIAAFVLFNNGELWGCGYNGYGILSTSGTTNVTTWTRMDDTYDYLNIFAIGGVTTLNSIVVEIDTEDDYKYLFAGAGAQNGGFVNVTTATQNQWSVCSDLCLFGKSAIESADSGAITPNATITATTQYSTYAAWYACYYGNTSDNAGANDPGDLRYTTASTTPFFQVEFSTAKVINRYAIKAFTTAARRPKSWTLKGSNNGSDWDTLDTQTSQTFVANYYTAHYSFSNSTAYTYYKLDVTENNGDATYTEIMRFALYESTTLIPTITDYWPYCTSSGTYYGGWWKLDNDHVYGSGWNRRGILGNGPSNSGSPEELQAFRILFPYGLIPKRMFGYYYYDTHAKAVAIMDDGSICVSGSGSAATTVGLIFGNTYVGGGINGNTVFTRVVGI